MGAIHKSLPQAMKAALRVIYPPQCLSCGLSVDQDAALCPACWRDCEFISDCACRCCGVPLPGMAADLSVEGEADRMLICDDCQPVKRPWKGARAALVYRRTGRQLLLALKHGDRPDLAAPLGRWLARAAEPLVVPGMIVAPIPLHPRRLIARKYNQAALLAEQVANAHGVRHVPGLLRRVRPTPSQDHRSHAERHANLKDAFALSPGHAASLSQGRPVLLVDDVMASGATMTAAAKAVRDLSSGPVSVAVLARAVKDAH